MGTFKALALLAFIVIATVIPLKAVAAGGKYPCGDYPCKPFKPELRDTDSLQRGAKLFVNYCMGCHSAQYQRWGRTATDLGIPEAIARDHLILGAQTKIGELMKISMTENYAKKVFGAAPPDLTLNARVRSPEWLYTYLTSFYSDASRPYGVNNLVFKDVGMPHVLLDLQGKTECRPPIMTAANGGLKRDAEGNYQEDPEIPCGRVVTTEEGQLSPAEFDLAMQDLVAYMTYMSEPIQLERKRIGTYVLMFIAIFFICAYLLNREYWKDVHH